MNSNIEAPALTSESMVAQLSDPAAYPHSVNGKIVVHETHISWVFVVGNFAYKVKKPIVTDFLDYGSLEKRHHACCEELRLDSRYADGLYLDVVPISFEDGQVRMDGDAQPIEFALRMRRFDEGALLSERIDAGRVSIDDMVQLGSTIANFHRRAPRSRDAEDALVDEIRKQAIANFEFLREHSEMRDEPGIEQLAQWSEETFSELESFVRRRMQEGFIRECHGDLHCDNIVFWHDHWVPFDGIEFNPNLSWIDVLNDVSFLVMDLQVRGRPDLAACFLNAYLEQSGDYEGLSLLRWYVVYRALVRAKVSLIREEQTALDSAQSRSLKTAAMGFVQIALEATRPATPQLWITHGVSGSGKTTGSLQFVRSENAIRLRSDVERKRLFGTAPADLKSPGYGQGMYSASASETVYRVLRCKAQSILQSGFSVVIDAAFLRQTDRQQFQELAKQERVAFHILAFDADEATLRKRVVDRGLAHNDASDADLAVLERQLRDREPLTAEELEWCAPQSGCATGKNNEA